MISDEFKPKIGAFGPSIYAAKSFFVLGKGLEPRQKTYYYIGSVCDPMPYERKTSRRDTIRDENECLFIAIEKAHALLHADTLISTPNANYYFDSF